MLAQGLPVSDKAIDDVSVVHVHNQNSVELFPIILAQLGAYLYVVFVQ